MGEKKLDDFKEVTITYSFPREKSS